MPVEVRVRFYDIDAANIVHFATYLRFFGDAEDETLRLKRITWPNLMERFGMGLTRAEATCRYSSPARLDDLLLVVPTIENLRKKGFRWNMRLVDSADHRLIADGSVQIVAVRFFDGMMKSAPMPDELFVKLGELQAELEQEAVAYSS